MSNHEQNETQSIKILLDDQVLGKTLSPYHRNNTKRVLISLVDIDRRLYSVEEKVDWIRNGGKYLGDAKGPSGTPGL